MKLVADADVVIEGFRPGVMDRLGLGYERPLRGHNPRVIYVALTGYGADGKYAALAGHDINYLALSGVLDLTGPPDGPPCLSGIQVADLAGGSMQAIIGILLAIEARHRTGRGQRVHVSMFAGAAALLPVPVSSLLAGERPERGKEMLSGRYACYQIYAAGGGTYVAVGALEPKVLQRNLCVELGCEELIEEQFADDAQARLKAVLAAKFLGASAEEWFLRLGSKDCCVTPVRALKDAIVGPSYGADSVLEWIRQDDYPTARAKIRLSPLPHGHGPVSEPRP